MPPKGSKKVDAKSNGVNKKKQVEELPATNVKKLPRSGRLRKMDEKEEIQDLEPIFDEEAIDVAPKKVNGSAEDKPDISEENVNGNIAEPEDVAAGTIKRGRKKAQTSTQDKKAKTNEISSDEITSTEAEPKKVTEESDEKSAEQEQLKTDEGDKSEEPAAAEPEKIPGKRGRKKAIPVAVNQNEIEETNAKQDVLEDKGVESGNPVAAEPEKIPGKRGRKKAIDPVALNQNEVEETNAKEDVLEAVPGPSKHSQKNKPDTAVKESVADVEAEDDGDFVPRKTRGGRNTKEVAPVARGRKRKVIDEKTEVKAVKKGKLAEVVIEKSDVEVQVDNNRQLRVDIQRNMELDEMAKNSSKEEEEIEEELEKDNVKEVKGASKSGRKRANKNDQESSKPVKASKKEAAEKKTASKKEQVPDTTSDDFENSSKSSDGKPWNFKIVSWNVNGIRAWLEKDGLLYLKLEQPDILCVQETKCSEAKLPPNLKEVEGYHCHWLAAEKEGYSGVGMLFKKKPISIKDGIGIEEHDNEGRVITAEYENFYLVTSYVPNAARGLTRLDYRMKWDGDFRAYLKELDEKKPVILCGDLNVAHEEIDLANPKGNKKNAGFTKEERDGFSALLKEGFVDAYRHYYPDTKDAYTFWTFMMNARAKNVGWRIDYFVVSERFTNHLCDSVIRKNVMGSDHCPIVLFLHF